MVIKTVEQNESTKIDSHKNGQLMFERLRKAIQWSKDSFFKKWKSDIDMQKDESQPKSHALYKNDLKMNHNSKCKM